ncbi:alpha-amylase family glycosyl hydrolase [Micromonospora soli]|nr:alpha-amylase family glycosyl hydrolase [Micromonospora sp. NBRC 110009]WKT97695.1 alpha-amylase family glycosyl hydrolase [Micromonospora sp. NBRC 110009]
MSVTALTVADPEFHTPTSTTSRLPAVVGFGVVTARVTPTPCPVTCCTNAGGPAANTGWAGTRIVAFSRTMEDTSAAPRNEENMDPPSLKPMSGVCQGGVARRPNGKMADSHLAVVCRMHVTPAAATRRRSGRIGLPSAFSGPFLEGLRTGAADRDGNGIVSVREAFEYAAVRMVDRERRQTPQMRAAGVGDLILSNAPRRPELIPDDLLALTRSGLASTRLLAVDELSNWAHGNHRTREQLVATFETLEALERDPAERVAARARQALSGRLRITRTEVEEEPDPEQPDDPNWAAGSTFYEVNVRFFYDSDGDGHGDLRGITEKLDYLRRLGVDCLLLNPIMAAPSSADGRAASDFAAIDSGLGQPSHLLELLTLAHRQGLRVVLDLVLNHTSDEHPWFQASRSDPDGPYGNFYVWRDTGDAYAEADDPLSSRGAGWTYDGKRRQYYLHRYSRHEPDLNYDAPEVRAAMRDVMDFWLRQGVDGLRLLTVPYLFERTGTSSKGLDETHTYLRELRSWLDSTYPNRIFIAWSEDWPEGAGSYFGIAEHPECHLVMYASLMPSLLLAMRRETHRPVSRVLSQMREQPGDRHWAVFLRNGDELSLGLLHERERQELLHTYAPMARMRGVTGIRRRTASLLNDDRGQLELAFALLLSMPGVPVLYYGDEIGMGENLSLSGNRAVNTPMQWAPDRNGGFSVAQPENLPAPLIHESIYGYMAVNVENQLRARSSLLHVVEKLLETRHAWTAFARPGCRIVRSTNPAVLAFLRGERGDEVLCLFNFSRYPQTPVRPRRPSAEGADGRRRVPDGAGVRRVRPRRGRSRLLLALPGRPGGCHLIRQQLSGVHQAPRVEQLLEPAHEVQLVAALVVGDDPPLRLPQPVLGADAAVAGAGGVVDDPSEVSRARLEFGVAAALGFAEVVVQVAVADVAVRHDPDARDQLPECPVGAGQERRDAADRHADVVLEAGAFMVLRFRDAFAQRPEGSGLCRAGGDDRVRHHPRPDRVAQRRLEYAVEAGGGQRVVQLHQGVPGMPLAEGVPGAGRVAQHEPQALPGHDLEAGQPVAGLFAEDADQVDPRLRARQGDPGRRAVPHGGEELQDGGGDHPEGAFRADEQLLEVVAGVVLPQPPEPVPDPPVGEHHLQPEGQVPHRAVAEHSGPAGVGREVAADGATSLRAEGEREEPAGGRRGRLHRLQHRAGFHGDRLVGEVDVADPPHPGQREHHLAAGVVRDRCAAQPGVAALRHHRDTRLGAERDDRGHLLRAARPHDGRGCSRVGVSPVARVPGHLARVVDQPGGPDHLPQPAHESRGHEASTVPLGRCGVDMITSSR